MKYRLPRSAERNDRGALLISIQEKMSDAWSKLHLVSDGTPTRSIAGSPTAHFSGCWHVPGCDCRKRLICDCRTSLRMVLSSDILNSAKADCFRSMRPHKLPWSVICRSDACLPPSTITCSLAWESRSCFGTTPTWHFAEPSRRSAFRAIRAFRGPRSMRCDTHLP